MRTYGTFVEDLIIVLLKDSAEAVANDVELHEIWRPVERVQKSNSVSNDEPELVEPLQPRVSGRGLHSEQLLNVCVAGRLSLEEAVGDWHPILSAREYQPCHWVLEDTFERAYALVDIVKRGDDIGYRVRALNETPRAVIGYYTNFRAACATVHMQWVTRGVPSGPASADWAEHWPTPTDPWS